MAAVSVAKLRNSVVTLMAAAITQSSCSTVGADAPPCDAASACKLGWRCVVGRCRDPETVLVSTLARRVAWLPTVRRIGADSESRGGEVPHEVRLEAGREPVTLVLGFEGVSVPAEPKPRGARDTEKRRPPSPGTLERALLVFEPAAIPDALTGEVEAEVAAVLDGWERPADSPATARLAPPMDAVKLTSRGQAVPGAAWVVDVTELVRGWTVPRRRRELVVALRASAGARAGFSMLDPDRRSPRLEVYFAPTSAELGPVPAEATTGTPHGETAPGSSNPTNGVSDGVER